jgi:hypothetical protein
MRGAWGPAPQWHGRLDLTAELRSLIYWNQYRMYELLVQTKQAKGRLSMEALGMSIDPSGAVRFEGKLQRREASPPSWTEVLDAVLEGLRDSGQLFGLRPQTIDEYRASEASYVFEATCATRVFLPVDEDLVDGGEQEELTVWISDPPARPCDPANEFDYFGAYLFLLEDGDPRQDVPRHRLFGSGASALVHLVSSAQQIDDEHRAQLGRDSVAHPIKKLEALGAYVSLERDIQTLYQVRYMSNEQGGFTVSEGRVNDILAYPLAIYS